MVTFRFFKIIVKPFSTICTLQGHTLKKVYSRELHEKIIYDTYAIFISDCLNKSICCGYSFELPRQIHGLYLEDYKIT